MEINFNGNFGGGIEIQRSNAEDGSKIERLDGKPSISGSVTFNRGEIEPTGVVRSEPTAEVPAEALRRDDDLGKMISSAFDLKPPPMPEFSGRP